MAKTLLDKKIGMTRFELATPATRTRCATKLRYIPIDFSRDPRTYGATSPSDVTFSHLFGRQSQAALHPDIIQFSTLRFACTKLHLSQNLTFSQLLFGRVSRLTLFNFQLLGLLVPSCYLSQNLTFSQLLFGRVSR